MGFIDEAQKILEYNRSLLSKKSIFETLSSPKIKRNRSEISTELLERSSTIFEIKRKKRNRLALVFILVPLILFVTIYAGLLLTH